MPPTSLAAPLFLPRGSTALPRCRKEQQTVRPITLMSVTVLFPVLWGERNLVWRRGLKGEVMLKVSGRFRSNTQNRIHIAALPLPPVVTQTAPWRCSTVSYRGWNAESQQQLLTGRELLIYITDKSIKCKNDMTTVYAKYSSSHTVLQELKAYSCAIKMSACKLHTNLNLWMDTDTEK